MLENLFPMTPAQSWLFILIIMLAAALVAYLIWYLDIVIQLSICNVKVQGLSGIWYALRGYECEPILRERVISVTRDHGAYRVMTTDGESNHRYCIITTSVDKKNPEYWESLEIAKGDKKVLQCLMSHPYVMKYFVLKNRETGEKSELFLVFTMQENPRDVEKAMQDFFDDEYYRECREARRQRRELRHGNIA